MGRLRAGEVKIFVKTLIGCVSTGVKDETKPQIFHNHRTGDE